MKRFIKLIQAALVIILSLVPQGGFSSIRQNKILIQDPTDSAETLDSSKIVTAEEKLSVGTKVKIAIPYANKFKTIKKNKDRAEQIVINWLRDSGEVSEYSYNKKLKKDLFYPVEITSGSKEQIGKRVFIPLQALSRVNQINFIVREEAIVLNQLSKKEYIPNKKPASEEIITPENAGTLTGLFLTVLQKSMDHGSTQIISAPSPKQVSNFIATCPLHFADFKDEVMTQSKASAIPAEILFSIMQVESIGKCSAARSEWDDSFSIGLFQVNTRSSIYPKCTYQQLRQLKHKLSLVTLKAEKLKCLQNPLVNLTEAIRILKEKYKFVNKEDSTSTKAWIEMNAHDRDGWRKAIAAYNGGQVYIIQAYNAVLNFNKKYKANLDANKWDVRRAFLLREMVDADMPSKKDQKEFIIKRRAIASNLINMHYVDRIAGLEGPRLTNSLANQWSNHL
jgi:hypothetical protein